MIDYLIVFLLFLIWLDNSRLGASWLNWAHNVVAAFRHAVRKWRK